MNKKTNNLTKADQQIYNKSAQRLSAMHMNQYAYQEILDDIITMLDNQPNDPTKIFDDYESFCIEVSKQALKQNTLEKMLYIASYLGAYFLGFMLLISIGCILHIDTNTFTDLITIGYSTTLYFLVHQSTFCFLVLMSIHIGNSRTFNGNRSGLIVLMLTTAIATLFTINFIPQTPIFISNTILFIILILSILCMISYRYYAKKRFEQYKWIK